MSEIESETEVTIPQTLDDIADVGTPSPNHKQERDPDIRQVDEFPTFGEIAHGELFSLTLSANTSGLTHGLHRFPAKYIPQVPRWAIKNFANAHSIVLDPFMGSGTTLVEALGTVEQSYGADIDPLARLISRAKTHKYNVETLRTYAKALDESRLPALNTCFLPMEGVKNVTHWFSESAWTDLCRIYTCINAFNCTPSERDFLLTVFSSTLRWVSNADDQSQKTYVSGTLKKTPPAVFPTFEKFLQRALVGIETLDSARGIRKATILDGSALSIPLKNASVDLIVTSPPYLDSVDYMYNFMLEYFWLGPKLGIPSRMEYNKKRRMPIGSKNPLVSINAVHPALVDLVDPRQIPDYRRKAALTYFDLMHKHFIEASRVMKDNARYVLVVGNSQTLNDVLPVHDCMLQLAKTTGLHLEKAFAYRIRRHYMKFPRKGRGGIILMDWVVTLRKTSQTILSSEDRLPLPKITIGDDEVAN